MTDIFNQKRDGFNARLLLYVKRKTGIHFKKITTVKKGVWIASSPKESWVIKEFPHPEKLKKQIILTDLLRKYGFNNTYEFHPIHASGPCFFEQRCLGIIQYIEYDKDKPFYYDSSANRKDSLALLCHFHSVSSKCLPMLKNQLYKSDLLEKWERRLGNFQGKCASLKDSTVYPYLNRYIQLGEFALRSMREYKSYFLKKPHCVLHGDLAHHNFIRKKDGSLFLIDFDLMAAGPKEIDILQYCNRILPSVDWSPDRLFSEGEAIRKYEKDIPFLVALLYPADIFREWNYFIAYDNKKQKKQWRHVKEITFHQFDKRMQFSKWILDQIK